MSRGTVNRTVLAVAGLVLALGGGLLLAGGTDLYDTLQVAMPRGWPFTSPHQAVLSAATRSRWSHRSWWWPTVITVLSVLVAGALAWLIAQLYRVSPTTVRLPAAGLDVRLRGKALQGALENEITALPGIERAGVQLTGTPRRPLLRTAVRLAPGTGPAELVALLRTGPLARTRAGLGLPRLPVELRLRVSGRRPVEPHHRVR